MMNSSSSLSSLPNYVLHPSDTHHHLAASSFPAGFIRVKLIELDPAPLIDSSVSQQLDPYCAISIKERIILPVTTTTTTTTPKKNQQQQAKPSPKILFNSESSSALLQIDSSSENHVKLVQRKPTFFPKWNTCFDCHLYPGRYISFQVYNTRGNDLLGEKTVTADALAAKARDRLTHQDWVRLSAHNINSHLLV